MARRHRVMLDPYGERNCRIAIAGFSAATVNKEGLDVWMKEGKDR